MHHIYIFFEILNKNLQHHLQWISNKILTLQNACIYVLCKMYSFILGHNHPLTTRRGLIYIIDWISLYYADACGIKWIYIQKHVQKVLNCPYAPLDEALRYTPFWTTDLSLNFLKWFKSNIDCLSLGFECPVILPLFHQKVNRDWINKDILVSHSLVI